MRILVKFAYLIILIVVLFFSFLFIGQNTQLVTLQIPLWTGPAVEARLATLIIAVFGLGAVVGILFNMLMLLITKGKLIRANWLLTQAKKQLATLESGPLDKEA